MREKDLVFESHMSGFVYKVRVDDQVLIKKEIPGPDTVDEFLYEINALSRLRSAKNVIQFYGVVVDDEDKFVKGLLISFAEQGALIDIIYDHDHTLPWPTRERWARQIVTGLSEIHEAGFVQGDFTLSNIVINDHGDAKIIDINRRGCPVGWEPPEATPLIESNQRISMYIGVKSDLYQLGMVLWALATQEDEPEAHGRPLRIGPEVSIPPWYRRIVDICLSEEPRFRMQALQLLSLFPEPEIEHPYQQSNLPSISVDDGCSPREYFVETNSISGAAQVRTVQPPNDWSYLTWGYSYPPTNGMIDDPHYYPTRGRSPPSPLPSHYDGCEPPYGRIRPTWSDHYNDAMTAPSVSDIPPDADDEETPEAARRDTALEWSTELPAGVGPRVPDHLEEQENGKQMNGLEDTEDATPTGAVAITTEYITSEEAAQEILPHAEEAEQSLQTEKDALVASGPQSMTEHEHTVGLVQTGEVSPPVDQLHDSTEVVGDSSEEPVQLGDADPEPEVSRAKTPQVEVLDSSPRDVQEEKSPIPVQPCSDDQQEVAPQDNPGISSAVGLDLAESAACPRSPSVRPDKPEPAMSPELPSDLTGVGSAHELTPKERQHSIEEEDLVVSAAIAELTITQHTTDDAK